MDFSSEIAKVKELLEKAQEILVVTSEKPTPDSVGSTLALYLGLVSLGKRVTLGCPDPMTVGLSSFIGVDKFKTELGQKNFVISLDYIDGAIEKVSYNIADNKFNLVIEPRPGFESFNENKVHFSQAGNSAQLIFAVAAPSLASLKKLYEEEKEFYAAHPIVNIDRHADNSQFGQINLVGKGASTTAEIMAYLLSGLGARLTADIATNLLNAIYQATDNFTSFTLTPAAFEVAAVCLKAGGKRFSVRPTEEARTEASPAKLSPMMRTSQGEEDLPASGQAPSASLDKAQDKSSGQAPEDWLKPKIFKSSNPQQP